LEYKPLKKIFISGENLPEKEKALFLSFHEFLDKQNRKVSDRTRQLVFSQQYIQLAWEYYSQGDMKNFRRCIRRLIQGSFLLAHLRFLPPYLKSFLGKGLSEKIHRGRKKITY
jgi:hypothetical protein